MQSDSQKNEKKEKSAISVVEDRGKACIGHHSEKHCYRQNQTLCESEVIFAQKNLFG